MLYRALHIAAAILVGQKGVAAGDRAHEEESGGGQGEGAKGGGEAEAERQAGPYPEEPVLQLQQLLLLQSVRVRRR